VGVFSYSYRGPGLGPLPKEEGLKADGWYLLTLPSPAGHCFSPDPQSAQNPVAHMPTCNRKLGWDRSPSFLQVQAACPPGQGGQVKPYHLRAACGLFTWSPVRPGSLLTRLWALILLRGLGAPTSIWSLQGFCPSRVHWGRGGDGYY
jgi:hypothetical protein